MPMIPQYTPPPPAASFPPSAGWLGIPLDAYKWMQSQMLQHPGTGYAPRGLLDQYPDVTPMIRDPGDRRSTGGLLATDVAAKIYQFNPFTEMRDPGAGGPRGLLGSQWRDPNFIQQYEVQRGLPPGSIKMPSAPVTQIAPPQGRQFDFGRFNDKVTDPRMLTPEARAAGPTPAQMARPVRMTPEIAAKLQAARDARAASEGMRLVEDTRALMAQRKGMKPFDSKVISDRFNKMSVDQREIFNREMFPWDYNK